MTDSTNKTRKTIENIIAKHRGEPIHEIDYDDELIDELTAALETRATDAQWPSKHDFKSINDHLVRLQICGPLESRFGAYLNSFADELAEIISRAIRWYLSECDIAKTRDQPPKSVSEDEIRNGAQSHALQFDDKRDQDWAQLSFSDGARWYRDQLTAKPAPETNVKLTPQTNISEFVYNVMPEKEHRNYLSCDPKEALKDNWESIKSMERPENIIVSERISASKIARDLIMQIDFCNEESLTTDVGCKHHFELVVTALTKYGAEILAESQRDYDALLSRSEIQAEYIHKQDTIISDLKDKCNLEFERGRQETLRHLPNIPSQAKVSSKGMEYLETRAINSIGDWLLACDWFRSQL